MSGSPDYILEIGGAGEQPRPPRRSRPRRRPWIAIHWRCCNTYSRIYRNRAGTAYVGHCPSCGKRAQAPIGPGGVDQRIFEAR